VNRNPISHLVISVRKHHGVPITPSTLKAVFSHQPQCEPLYTYTPTYYTVPFPRQRPPAHHVTTLASHKRRYYGVANLLRRASAMSIYG